MGLASEAGTDLRSSGFNLLSTLGCGGCGHSISRPLGGGGGWGSAEQHKGQVYLSEGACLRVHGGLAGSGSD